MKRSHGARCLLSTTCLRQSSVWRSVGRFSRFNAQAWFGFTGLSYCFRSWPPKTSDIGVYRLILPMLDGSLDLMWQEASLNRSPRLLESWHHAHLRRWEREGCMPPGKAGTCCVSHKTNRSGSYVCVPPQILLVSTWVASLSPGGKECALRRARMPSALIWLRRIS